MEQETEDYCRVTKLRTEQKKGTVYNLRQEVLLLLLKVCFLLSRWKRVTLV